ncbi:MAG TPA: AbrB/MazE/SpoVT family DNA-binding domain-containing protein [Thermoanaerobaculia bacterium]|nr:AbrB/MazE/SpoVT family DNA-binding domain-containing protein [Thermoanaerobaculia bacterium]
MSRSKITTKGQITLPKDIREHLGVDAGDRISFEIRDGAVVIEAETVDIRTLRGMVGKRGAKVSLAAMEQAIRRGASGR